VKRSGRWQKMGFNGGWGGGGVAIFQQQNKPKNDFEFVDYWI